MLEEQTLVAQYKAKAAPEVRGLRRELDRSRVSELLATRRAEKSELQAGKARSFSDICSRQLSEAQEQATSAMSAMNAMRLEMECLVGENDRLRQRLSRGHTASLEEQLKEQQCEIKTLRERRTNNMGATRQLNLERKRCQVLCEQVEALRQTIRDAWGRDTIEQAEAGAMVPRLKAEIDCLVQALATAEGEVASLRRVLCPPKPMVSGAYDMKLRFTIMKLISCGPTYVTRTCPMSSRSAPHTSTSCSPVDTGKFSSVCTTVCESMLRSGKHGCHARTHARAYGTRQPPHPYPTPMCAILTSMCACVDAQVRDGSVVSTSSWRVHSSA